MKNTKTLALDIWSTTLRVSDQRESKIGGFREMKSKQSYMPHFLRAVIRTYD